MCRCSPLTPAARPTHDHAQFVRHTHRRGQVNDVVVYTSFINGSVERSMIEQQRLAKVRKCRSRHSFGPIQKGPGAGSRRAALHDS